MSANNKERLTDWHSAVFQAYHPVFKRYLAILIITKEHQLTSQPLRIDILIIKKIADIPIEAEIGEIFRGHNIVEYKGPDDYISKADYYKALGYAYIYQALEGVSVEDMSLTIVGTRYPRKLLDFIAEEREFTVREKHPGIYVIEGEIFPIQIIETKKLVGEDNIWLKSLSNNLTAVDLAELLEAKTKLGVEFKMDAYMNAIFEANAEVVKEVRAMGSSALLKVLDEMGLIEEWKQEGERKGIRKGVKRTLLVIKCLKNNIPIEQIAVESDMPIEEIEKIKSEL
ncbi:MAG: hypothetical protein LBS62_07250 [Clostridiales bacterium]|nr:hypothetical protein [Clostridiales bacterium]